MRKTTPVISAPFKQQIKDKKMSDNKKTSQIDWTTLIVEYEVDEETRRGISLRKLADAGLYVNYRDALSAAQKAGMEVFRVTLKTSEKGGRPGRDIIFKDLEEAKKFCARARTPVGQ